VGELRPYPSAGSDWLDAMLLVARQQLTLRRRHPWLLDVVHRTAGVGPETLAWFDHCLRILEPVRCPVTAKFEAIAMMIGVVGLVARSEITPQPTFVGVELTSYPHLAAAFGRPSGRSSQGDLFERTVRILLTGLLVAEPQEQP
jgi:hypothetical protein